MFLTVMTWKPDGPSLVMRNIRQMFDNVWVSRVCEIFASERDTALTLAFIECRRRYEL
jgi:hypothetical protein